MIVSQHTISKKQENAVYKTGYYYYYYYYYYYHHHYYHHLHHHYICLTAFFSRTAWISRHQKGNHSGFYWSKR